MRSAIARGKTSIGPCWRRSGVGPSSAIPVVSGLSGRLRRAASQFGGASLLPEHNVNFWAKKEPADPVEAAQQGVGRFARLAAEATADGAGQCLLLGQGAALGTAARGQMTERMVLGAKARSRPARRAARERRAIGAKREGAAAILSIVRSHATSLSLTLVIPALQSYIVSQLNVNATIAYHCSRGLRDGHCLVSFPARSRGVQPSRSGAASAARAVGCLAHAERRAADETAGSSADLELSRRLAGRGIAARLRRRAADGDAW